MDSRAWFLDGIEVAEVPQGLGIPSFIFQKGLIKQPLEPKMVSMLILKALWYSYGRMYRPLDLRRWTLFAVVSVKLAYSAFCF